MNRLLAVLCTLAALHLAGAPAWAQQPADGTCSPLRAADLPFIGQPGVYCLTEDVQVAITSGYAIQIVADDVVLDLGGHTVENVAGKPGQAHGVAVYDQTGTVIRNGTIRGFHGGVTATLFETLANLVIEDLRVEHSERVGISISGSGGVRAFLRRNVVTDTGRGYEVGNAYGISAHGGQFHLQDNVVTNTSSENYSFGIGLSRADHSTVVDSRVTYVDRGIHVQDDSVVICRDNLTTGIAYSSYTNCTDAGNNF